MLRWGIMGIDDYSVKFIAPALRAIGHDLAIVAAPVLTEAQSFAANQGVRRARSDYREVLESEDVNAVWVGLEQSDRDYWVEEALGAGKHVLCAKPLGSDADGAARMAVAAAASGDLVLMEALPVRFHPRTTALLNYIEKGGIGEVRLVEASLSVGPYNLEEYSGVGATLELGADLVSLARWIIGSEPDTVRSVSRFAPSGVDSSTSSVLGFSGGRLASLYMSLDSYPCSSLKVLGSEGLLEMPDPFTVNATKQVSILHNKELIGSWRADPWESLVDYFEQAVKGSTQLLNINDAVATAHVLDSIRRFDE